MQFGRTYEEFEVGAVYKHWPGKTVTEYDDHLFCLLTMNHHPLHMDANYAENTTDFGKNVVVGEQPPGYPADAYHYILMKILMAARANNLQAIDGPERARVCAARRAGR